MRSLFLFWILKRCITNVRVEVQNMFLEFLRLRQKYWTSFKGKNIARQTCNWTTCVPFCHAMPRINHLKKWSMTLPKTCFFIFYKVKYKSRNKVYIMYLNKVELIHFALKNRIVFFSISYHRQQLITSLEGIHHDVMHFTLLYIT